MLTTYEMELINECSMRFAEDKDFRLLVSYVPFSLYRYLFSLPRLLTVLWPCFVWIIPDGVNSAKGSKRYIRSWTRLGCTSTYETVPVGTNAFEIDQVGRRIQCLVLFVKLINYLTQTL